MDMSLTNVFNHCAHDHERTESETEKKNRKKNLISFVKSN